MNPLGMDEIRQAVGGQWLARPADGAVVSGVCTDSRTVCKDDLFIPLKGERFDAHSFLPQVAAAGAAAAMVNASANVSPQLAGAFPKGVITVDDTGKALECLGAYYRKTLETTVVAVTGSNGKTTVKRMIHHILSKRLKGSCSPKSFNNNIGVPLTLLGANGGDDYVICEVGSNAPGEIAALAAITQPDIAVITSVGKTHLEKLGSIEGVAVEKASILAHLRRGGLAIVFADSQPLTDAIEPYNCRFIRFGQAGNADLRLTEYKTNCESRIANRELNDNDNSNDNRGDVGATTRAASVSASDTPSGGYAKPKMATDLRYVKLDTAIEETTRGRDARDTNSDTNDNSESKKQHTGKMPVRRMGETPMPRTTPMLQSNRFQINGQVWVDMPLPGRHNASNAIAAIAVAMQFGFSLEEAAAAMADFVAVDGRLQSMACGSITLINDAYNANPSSVLAAADVLADSHAARRVMVVGDMRELGGDARVIHEQTGCDIAQRGIDLLIGVGELGQFVASGAAKTGLAAHQFASVELAADGLPKLLQPGDVVLIKGSRAMAMERLIDPIRATMTAMPADNSKGAVR